MTADAPEWLIDAWLSTTEFCWVVLNRRGEYIMLSTNLSERTGKTGKKDELPDK